MDNNESFSVLVHASNLYSFPLSRTLGLTDEAFSPHEAAHPYVYTHQGNFPRAFAFVLYVLGARNIESQIVITTFTAGVLGLLVMYRYFTLAGGALFATIASAIALTDYVFFVQWQVNTFRVWQVLFFFLALLCVHGLEGRHSRRWLGLTLAAFAAMFYFELVFATFVAVMAGLYAALRFGTRNPRILIRCWSVQVAGALLGIGLLIAQLIGYLGWSDFLQDLNLTYSARNLIAADPANVQVIRDFVESRRLVFWFNFASQEYGRTPWEVVGSVARGYFTIFTPTLWYCTVIMLVGWAAGLAGSKTQRADRPSVPDVSSRIPASIPAMAVGALFIAALTRFLVAIVDYGFAMGAPGTRLVLVGSSATAVAVIAAVILAGVVTRLSTRQWWGFRALPTTQALLAALALVVAEYVIANTPNLFEPSYTLLWQQMHQPWMSAWVVQGTVLCIGLVAVLVTLGTIPHAGSRYPAIGAFLVTGAVAYAAVYALSPGYIHSGYLVRHVPFLSFVLYACLGLVVYVLWRAASYAVSTTAALAAGGSSRVRGVGLRMLGACAVVPLLVVVTFWIQMQTAYAQLLPPTHFTFIKKLGEPPYRGASFAANTYAAPIYAYTRQWAYFDTRLGLPGGGLVRMTDEGPVVDRDADSYLWLADRHENMDYLRPSYFLCFTYQDLGTAMRRLRGIEGGCSSAGLVRYADASGQLTVADTIADRDPSKDFMWAIVKLDWNVGDATGARNRSE